jgi:hypothetical protein
MEVSFNNKGKVIFVRDDLVHIVVSGYVVIRNHDETFMPPKILAKMGPGSILGHEGIDDGLSCLIETWIVCMTNVELIHLPR